MNLKDYASVALKLNISGRIASCVPAIVSLTFGYPLYFAEVVCAITASLFSHFLLYSRSFIAIFIPFRTFSSVSPAASMSLHRSTDS